jgi:queuine/archaeosine tRNA-ribosyltransferase
LASVRTKPIAMQQGTGCESFHMRLPKMKHAQLSIAASHGPARCGTMGAAQVPTVSLPTHYGQLPNLLRDTSLCLTAPLAPIVAMRQLHFWDHESVVHRSSKTLSQYCSMPDKVSVMTLRPPSDMERYEAGDETLSVSITAGMRQLSVPQFCRQVAGLQPDVVVAMHDDVPQSAGKNRRRNAAERSAAWLEGVRRGIPLAAAALRISSSGSAGAGASAGADAAGVAGPRLPVLFAAVPAVSDPLVRSKLIDALKAAAAAAAATPSAPGAAASARSAGASAACAADAAAASLPVEGFAFTNSFWSGERGLDTELLRSAAAALPPALPRLLSAPCNPLEVLDAVVLCGMDVVDSDYATALASAGRALCFDWEFEAAAGGASTASSGDSASASASSSAAGGTAASAAAPHPAVVDMADSASHRLDGRPLREGCPCFACAGASAEASGTLERSGLAAGGIPVSAPSSSAAAAAAGSSGAASAGPSAAAAAAPAAGAALGPAHPGHSRAYIHHLVNCSEIMGRAVLSAHNHVHLARFMEAVRAHVASGTITGFRDDFRARYPAAAFPALEELRKAAAAADNGGREALDGEGAPPPAKRGRGNNNGGAAASGAAGAGAKSGGQGKPASAAAAPAAPAPVADALPESSSARAMATE